VTSESSTIENDKKEKNEVIGDNTKCIMKDAIIRGLTRWQLYFCVALGDLRKPRLGRYAFYL
jgi:hypothetical protein